MVNVQEILADARESMTVKRVYGEPIEKDGVTIIPVARISGGGGGGGGQDDEGSGGGGVGYGVQAQPVGVYVIRDGNVSWEPAQASIDLTRVIISGNLVVIAALFVLGMFLKSRNRR